MVSPDRGSTQKAYDAIKSQYKNYSEFYIIVIQSHYFHFLINDKKVANFSLPFTILELIPMNELLLFHINPFITNVQNQEPNRRNIQCHTHIRHERH